MLPLGRAESVNKGIYSQSLDVGGATRRELREVALNGPVDELSANLFKDTVATTRHAGSYDATINCPHVPAATIERDQHGNVCSILLAQRLEPESAANSFRAKLQAHPRGRETIDYTQYVDVPNLAQRVPSPDLTKSEGLVTSKADQILAKESSSFNCHFYTATYVLGHEPQGGFIPVVKDMCSFGEQFLLLHRFRKVQTGNPSPGEKRVCFLKEGDIILIKDHSKQEAMSIIHSAVAISAKKRGEVLIRQKFDASHPIVDLTPSQFQRAYLYDDSEEIEVWRK